MLIEKGRPPGRGAVLVERKSETTTRRGLAARGGRRDERRSRFSPGEHVQIERAARVVPRTEGVRAQVTAPGVTRSARPASATCLSAMAGPWAVRGSRRSKPRSRGGEAHGAMSRPRSPPAQSSRRRTPSVPTARTTSGAARPPPGACAMEGHRPVVVAVRHLDAGDRVAGADGVGERRPAPPQAQVVLQGGRASSREPGRQETRGKGAVREELPAFSRNTRATRAFRRRSVRRVSGAAGGGHRRRCGARADGAEPRPARGR